MGQPCSRQVLFEGLRQILGKVEPQIVQGSYKLAIFDNLEDLRGRLPCKNFKKS